MEINAIFSIVTMIVTFICGLIAKRVKWFNNKLIPMQNLIIGLVAGGIYYYMTRDISLVIMTCGLGAGGTYDLVKNLISLFQNNKKVEETK